MAAGELVHVNQSRNDYPQQFNIYDVVTGVETESADLLGDLSQRLRLDADVHAAVARAQSRSI